ncbi:SMARCA3-like protein [Cladobotryum mycophilum]|uniref:SMARCA3-like protein n=1 Tax=Cladobotryum mycophilum TaxID=491253 RepID=A0ABR0S553_9HYPO
MDANQTRKRRCSQSGLGEEDVRRSKNGRLRKVSGYTMSSIASSSVAAPDCRIGVTHQGFTGSTSSLEISSQLSTSNFLFTPNLPSQVSPSHFALHYQQTWGQGQSTAFLIQQNVPWTFPRDTSVQISQVNNTCHFPSTAHLVGFNSQPDSPGYTVAPTESAIDLVRNSLSSTDIITGTETNDRKTQSIRKQEIVCFGMIIDVTATCHVPTTANPLQRHLVKFQDALNFVNDEFTNLMHVLYEEPGFELEVSVSLKETTQSTTSGSQGRTYGLPRKHSLAVIIYGPFELFDDVGDFFEQRDLYLQDPDESIEMEDVVVRPELLDILDSQEDLAETEQPPSIKTKLARHQKQALTFMQRREHGWAMDGSSPDIWEAVEAGQEILFLNRISATNQVKEPPQFYGGIVADPMGLGKTLSMIALIARDLHLDENDHSSLSEVDKETSSGCTLVIVPPAPHVIRNSNSQTSQAICSLDSVSRWAVTGTPIQNKLGDLTALLKFLKVHPYSDKKIFDVDICQLWKSGRDEEAVKRLKGLSGCLILRRPKGIIKLPPRQDEQCPVEFTEAERSLYEKIKAQAIAHIDDALLHHGDTRRSNSFVNVLQRIEAMRMVCNLGLRYPSRHEAVKQSDSHPRDWKDAAQDIFDMRRNMGQIQCSICLSILDSDENFLGDATQSDKPLFFQCLTVTCSNCAKDTSRSGKPFRCEHEPACSVTLVSLDNSWDEIPIQTTYGLGGNYPLEFPTKIKVLLDDLQKLPGDVKCVVFSTWRMTLDVVKAALDHASIPSVRFDGTVQQKDRQNIVDRFRNDPTVRVMLLTLSCGAVGLTLTAASRAYLMEPHWNPTLEDQALARIHRMGQTREVTTIRLYVRDSFEERVIESQESKRDLAALLLNPHGRPGQGDGQSGIPLKPLELLRRLIN